MGTGEARRHRLGQGRPPTSGCLYVEGEQTGEDDEDDRRQQGGPKTDGDEQHVRGYSVRCGKFRQVNDVAGVLRLLDLVQEPVRHREEKAPDDDSWRDIPHLVGLLLGSSGVPDGDEPNDCHSHDQPRVYVVSEVGVEE